MRFILFLLLLSSCTQTTASFFIKNNSSQILTLTNIESNRVVKIVPSLCFKFIGEDFPLYASFGNQYNKTSILNQASHYTIDDSQVYYNSVPCQPTSLQ
ncbi:MAG: hypothetical protein ACR2M7_01625 [Bdellovibrionales bacterium]